MNKLKTGNRELETILSSEMKIDNYYFGELIIAGVSYKQDLIIFPRRIMTNWWRKEGHSLSVEDLQQAFEYQPDLLIIGTGAYGALKVSQDLIDLVQKKGIEIKVRETKAAVLLHNREESILKTVTALHLTC